MRRVMRWLKHLLTGGKEEHRGLEANRVATDWSDGPEREKRRWSFAKHRKSGADGGARSSGQLAAATAAAEPPLCRKEDTRTREEKAAILIQKTFRGYLARRALRALRSLVKIQALVRGYLVRKQAAMTLHRLQTLMRLQADSIAVKNASYRKSMEREVIQMERIFAQEVRMKAPSHRRRLSDSTDSNYERSPRIVEMDTCHLRSRSSRITNRYNPDHSSEYHRLAAPSPSCSPLPGGKQQQPARLSFRPRSSHERDHPRGSKTAQNTPRSHSHESSSSPAKSIIEQQSLSSGTPRRRDRDALVSPRYMAGTASSAARTRCHSAPRQRLTEAPRVSLTARAGRTPGRSSCAHARGGGGFCFQCSDATRTGGCAGISGASDEVARDYYLDSFW